MMSTLIVFARVMAYKPEALVGSRPPEQEIVERRNGPLQDVSVERLSKVESMSVKSVLGGGV